MAMRAPNLRACVTARGQLPAADARREAEVVLDPPREARLSAEHGALDDQRVEALGRAVDRRAQAARPAADHDEVDLLARAIRSSRRHKDHHLLDGYHSFALLYPGRGRVHPRIEMDEFTGNCAPRRIRRRDRNVLAVVGTLLRYEVVEYQWIIDRVLPWFRDRRPARLSDANDGRSSTDRHLTRIRRPCLGLIGTAEYYRHTPGRVTMTALALEILLGFLTFTASLMAFGKLQELLPTRPITYTGPEHCQPVSIRVRSRVRLLR